MPGWFQYQLSRGHQLRPRLLLASDPIELGDLHDATLTAVEIDWASGDLRFRFQTHAGAIGVRARRFSELRCPRQQPWGPSRSVNSATAEPRDLGIRLIIEMQSGDVIEASIEDFVVEP